LLSDLPDDLTQIKSSDYFAPSFYKSPSEENLRKLSLFLRDYSERLAASPLSREQSREMMKQANPKFILRNYLLHQAIEELEQGKDSLFRKLELELKTPYDEQTEFFARRPDWASSKAGCSMLSCSS